MAPKVHYFASLSDDLSRSNVHIVQNIGFYIATCTCIVIAGNDKLDVHLCLILKPVSMLPCRDIILHNEKQYLHLKTCNSSNSSFSGAHCELYMTLEPDLYHP